MPARAEGSHGHPLAVAVRLLRADAPSDIEHDPQSWPRWAALLPHLLAATAHLDREEAPVAALLEDASGLLDLAGSYLRVHARLNDARPLLERDELAETPGGPAARPARGPKKQWSSTPNSRVMRGQGFEGLQDGGGEVPVSCGEGGGGECRQLAWSRLLALARASFRGCRRGFRGRGVEVAQDLLSIHVPGQCLGALQ